MLASAPRDLAALNGRGVAFDMLGRHDEAQQSYRQARALAPDDISVANNLAMSFILAGMPQQAVPILEPLARRADAPPRVANNLAIARASIGEAPAERQGLRGEQMSQLLVALQ